MARPKNPEIEARRQQIKALKPLPPFYRLRVADHFPTIDSYKLGQAVAGRVDYPEGLEALKVICALYPRKKPALQPA